jgi:hypothetical protein
MKSILRMLLCVWLGLAAGQMALAAEPGHNFQVWEKEIAAYERADSTNPPPKGGFEFVGSSTIARWKTLTTDYSGLPVFNRGFGGCEIVDCTHFADQIVFPYEPRAIFFRAGGNDLAAGKSAEQVFADFQEFCAVVHARLPDTEIYYISWSPTPLRWSQHEAEKTLNDSVAAFAKDKPYLKYIETSDLPLDADGHPRPELFMGDRLHFNAAGYKLLAGRVRPFVTAAAGAAAH